MAKPVVALFDSDRAYVDRFLSYLKSGRKLSFEVIGFSDQAALNSYLESRKPNLLLISLSNPECFKAIIPSEKEESEEACIDKYQSMENILSEVRRLLPSLLSQGELFSDSKAEFLGVYSPGGGKVRTLFSLALAKAYSSRYSVLYVNFERFSGLAEIISLPENGTSEMIMHRLRAKEQFEHNFSKSIGRMNDFDILLSPANMEDMDELTEEEWEKMFADIRRLGGYDVLILDFAESFREIDSIFDMCRAVYVPKECGFFTSAQERELKEYLEKRGRTDLAQKLIVLEFKSEDIRQADEGFFEGNYYGQIVAAANEAAGLD